MSLAKKLYLLKFQSIRFNPFAVILCVLILFMPAQSIASGEINITEVKGIYRIEVNMKLDVAADYVRDVILDMAHIYRLNSSIIESEVLTSQVSNETRLRTRLLLCIPSFCREVERVDNIRILPTGEIQSKIIPELSDFSSGNAVWKITSLDDGRTLLQFQESVDPDFYVPSMVGVRVVKKQFIITLERIEHIAKINAQRASSGGLPLVELIE